MEITVINNNTVKKLAIVINYAVNWAVREI
jgi:hypothetical protein